MTTPKKSADTPAADAKASPSAPERLATDQSYKPLSEYGPEDKITPPAVQTRAVNPTVVGEALDAALPNSVVSDDKNEETGNKGNAEPVTKTSPAGK